MKKILIITTGGTIAGTGQPGMSRNYVSGSGDPRDMLSSINLDNIDADIYELCSINSDDMTLELMCQLARIILDTQDMYDGFVVTHGTDTMEETAFFLSLIRDIVKPVIFTGAMRPMTSLSADGDINIRDAVCVACEECLAGVYAVFAGRILSGRSLEKASNISVDPFEGLMCGYVSDGKVYTFAAVAQEPVFDLSALKNRASVNVLYFSVVTDPRMIDMAAGISDGLVIAGAGAGEMSICCLAALDWLSIPVVVSSRTRGIVTDTKHIPAYTLSPQKAAVLLSLGISAGCDIEQLRKLFARVG